MRAFPLSEQGIRCFTFYAAKGGVGRTFALVHVALHLARDHNKRVLAVDWDLEAPTLHSLFSSQRNYSKGLLEYLQDSLDEFDQLAQGQSPRRVSLSDYVSALDIGSGSIDLLCSGNMNPDVDYFRQVESLNWEDFYRKGGFWTVERLREAALAGYDIVLIDAPPGRSKTSAVPMLQVADLLVMIFAANNNGLDITRNLAETLFRNKARDRWGRDPLRFLFAPLTLNDSTPAFIQWVEGPLRTAFESMERSGVADRVLQPNGAREFVLDLGRAEPFDSNGAWLHHSTDNYARLAQRLVELAAP